MTKQNQMKCHLCNSWTPEFGCSHYYPTESVLAEVKEIVTHAPSVIDGDEDYDGDNDNDEPWYEPEDHEDTPSLDTSFYDHEADYK